MKRILLSAAVMSVTLLSLSSCKKDYACVCTDATGNDKAYQLQGLRESDAQTACDDYEITTGNDCALQEQ